MNDDKISDILVTDMSRSNGSFGIFFGFGDDNFTLPSIYPTGFSAVAVASTDFCTLSRSLDIVVICLIIDYLIKSNVKEVDKERLDKSNRNKLSQ